MRQKVKDGDITHDGVRAIDGGGVVGDSVTSRASIEARGETPIDLTTMKGVVLGGEGQWLPFLENNTHTGPQGVTHTHRNK